MRILWSIHNPRDLIKCITYKHIYIYIYNYNRFATTYILPKHVDSYLTRYTYTSACCMSKVNNNCLLKCGSLRDCTCHSLYHEFSIKKKDTQMPVFDWMPSCHKIWHLDKICLQQHIIVNEYELCLQSAEDVYHISIRCCAAIFWVCTGWCLRLTRLRAFMQWHLKPLIS